MRTWDGHEANSLAYMAAFSAYTCMWDMQYGACSMWLPVTSGTQMWQPTRLDSTRLDSTLPQTVCHCLWPVDLWHGAHAACCNVACLLPACCLFCLLKCRKCCGSQQAVARGRRAGKQRCNWQLATAPNGCKQQMLSGCRHSQLCALPRPCCNSDWNCTCLRRVAAADGVAALATGIERCYCECSNQMPARQHRRAGIIISSFVR